MPRINRELALKFHVYFSARFRSQQSELRAARVNTVSWWSRGEARGEGGTLMSRQTGEFDAESAPRLAILSVPTTERTTRASTEARTLAKGTNNFTANY